MRQIYETESDRRAEEAVAAHLGRLSGLTMVRAGRLSGWDWEAMIGAHRIAIVEIKCRTKKYDTMIISSAKVQKMLEDSEDDGVAANLVVRWPDGVWIVDLRHCAHWEGEGGRKDRNDRRDVERVWHIPVNEFRQLPMEN